MAFRKRNVGLSTSANTSDIQSTTGGPLFTASPSSTSEDTPESCPGVRPSPVDGRPTISTGTASLDALLAGHAGLALGTSVLIEESGTTDYGGVLLRYFAAEGVVQGHKIHVVGVGDTWGRDLPGLTGVAGEEAAGDNKSRDKDQMKIAWRYERLGDFGAGVAGSRGIRQKKVMMIQRLIGTAAPTASKNMITSAASDRSASTATASAFCHTFDLTKRLPIPSPSPLTFIPSGPSGGHNIPFPFILETLSKHLLETASNTIHRLIIPAVLSPALYPASVSQPTEILQFLHSLRSLLRQFPTRLSVMLTLPLELYPRSAGLTRWMELLSDGVLELTPFPHQVDAGPATTASGAATAQEEQPQGMLKIHRLPVFHEKGGGGGGGSGLGDDLAFTVSRKRFVIKPFSLPPVEGDAEAQQENSEVGDRRQTTSDIDF